MRPKRPDHRHGRRHAARLPKILALAQRSAQGTIPLDLARSLALDRPTYLLGVITVPKNQSLSQAASDAQALRTRLRQEARKMGERITPRVLVSHQPAYEIASIVAEQNIETLVLRWEPDVADSMHAAHALSRHAPCNMAVLRGDLPQRHGSIAVVLRPGEDSELALRTGLALAKSGAHSLSAVRLMDDRGSAATQSQTRGLSQVLEHLPDVNEIALATDDALQALLDLQPPCDLMVIGASAAPRGKSWIDELALGILNAAPWPVLVLRSAPQPPPAEDMAGVQAISILVDKWFAENTFHAREFEDLGRLVERKQRQGLTISLALPALNEEETVGKVIDTVQHALMTEVPLLDEIVLIDSNSTDRTREIAREYGIPVYIHQQILPQYGAHQGKGEALWKSLYVTSGDLILWIDTDIVNIHPRFVYGLIGPLLLRPDLMFVKGFYLRPMRVGSVLQAGGGGRVTELTARPLLNLFFPALSGLIQPLSGEYGGRRAALEQMPFSTGYGVETGLLIDMLEEYGLRAIAQVDLIRRVHHNQPLTALSKMSFAIIQTLIRKLDRRYGTDLLEDVNRAMKIIRHEEGRFFLDVEEVAERERPAMITLPEYRKRFPARPS